MWEELFHSLWMRAIQRALQLRRQKLFLMMMQTFMQMRALKRLTTKLSVRLALTTLILISESIRL